MAELSKNVPRRGDCPVCRQTRACSFCNGDGYVIESDKMRPCGVCRGSGGCQVCAPEEEPVQ